MNYSVVGAALIGGVLWLAASGAWKKHYDLYLAIENDYVRQPHGR